MEVLAGVDIGGTRIKALLFDSDGKILLQEEESTSDDGSKDWLVRVRDVFRKLSAKAPGPLRAVGVAAPGLPSPDGRSIRSMPGRLAGLENLDWQEWLGLDMKVPVFNDARAALLGEAWIGAARGARNITLLTLGTGVGGAAMVDGKLLHGHIGRAGHLGHVSLDPDGTPDIANAPGSLEDAIGEHTIAARSKGRYKSTLDLVAAFNQGSQEAATIWLKSVNALAAAIAGFVNILDPEFVLIGGGIADANDSLFKPLASALDRFEWRPGGARVTVRKAALGNHAGAAGAAYGSKLAASLTSIA